MRRHDDNIRAEAAPRVRGRTAARRTRWRRRTALGRGQRDDRPQVLAARLRAGKRRDRWFENYLKTLVDKDLRDLSDAYKIEETSSLLRLLGAQAAGLYSASNIADRMKLNNDTVKAYTRLLETVFLVKRIGGWRPGIGSREVQTPKVFITDSGLLAHLLGANAQRAAEDGQVTGKLYENFVAMEVARLVDWAETSVSLGHYRDRNDEVDIVLESRTGEIACIECKAAATVRSSDYKPMTKLRDARGDKFIAGVVLYTGADTIPLGDRIWAVPVGALWTDA